MSHHALGEQFSKLLTDYHAERGDPAWDDHEAAHGRCFSASCDFVAYARSKGHTDAELVDATRATPNWFRGEHVAARVGSHVVDWTARQLDPGAPVPHVTPHDPAVHGPHANADYRGEIPPGRAPREVGAPKWAPPKFWDDMTNDEQRTVTDHPKWVRY